MRDRCYALHKSRFVFPLAADDLIEINSYIKAHYSITNWAVQVGLMTYSSVSPEPIVIV